MPISIACDNCGTRLKAPDTAAGRKIKCPKCGEAVPVPAAAAEEPVAAAALAPVPRPQPPVRPAPPEDDFEPPVRSRRGPDLDEDEPPARARRSLDRPSGEKFEFDGGAGGFVGTGILCFLCLFVPLVGPLLAMIMFQKWRISHTLIGGRRLKFVGSVGSLFVLYLVIALLSGITLGIYTFWAIPKWIRWWTENTAFADAD